MALDRRRRGGSGARPRQIQPDCPGRVGVMDRNAALAQHLAFQLAPLERRLAQLRRRLLFLGMLFFRHGFEFHYPAGYLGTLRPA